MLNPNELKAARARRGVTQSQIAERLSIPVSQYSMKETGKRPLSLKDVDDITRVLGLSAREVRQIFFAKEVHAKGELGRGFLDGDADGAHGNTTKLHFDGVASRVAIQGGGFA